MSDDQNVPQGSITFSIVYNNILHDKRLQTGWGFSCLIQGLEKTILFDTGSPGKELLANMEILSLDPSSVDIIVLSHDHDDHTGGLEDFLSVNPSVSVYVLTSFSENTKQQVRSTTAVLHEITGPQQLCANAWTSGEIAGPVNEQALILNHKNGLILITGCAHPGIEKFVHFARDTFQKDVFLAFGGFHLKSENEDTIAKVIEKLQELKVEKVGPSHCTGPSALAFFKEKWGKDFMELYLGSVATL